MGHRRVCHLPCQQQRQQPHAQTTPPAAAARAGGSGSASSLRCQQHTQTCLIRNAISGSSRPSPAQTGQQRGCGGPCGVGSMRCGRYMSQLQVVADARLRSAATAAFSRAAGAAFSGPAAAAAAFRRAAAGSSSSVAVFRPASAAGGAAAAGSRGDSPVWLIGLDGGSTGTSERLWNRWVV